MKNIDLKYEKLLQSLKNGSITQINRAFSVMINDLSLKISRFSNHDSKINKRLQQELVKIKREFVNTYNDILKKYDASAISLSERKNIQVISKQIAGLEIKTGLVKSWLGRPDKPIIKKLSGRVWNINKGFYSNLETVLRSGMLEGKPAHEIKIQLTRLLNEPSKVDINELRRQGIKKSGGEKEYRKLEKEIINYKPGAGVYKSSKKNAFRLARTEINRAYRNRDNQIRQRLPFVVGIEVKLSGNHPFEDICDDMQGIYPKDYDFMGWHPNCICYTKAILATKEQTAKLIADMPVKLKQVKNIPKRAVTYIKTKAPKINKLKTTPYFIDENPKYFKHLLIE